MMENFRGAAITMLMTVTTRLGQCQSFADTHLVALTCAFMFASAFALPSFSPSVLGLKGLYEFTLGIFLFSAIAFGLINRIEIKENIAPGLAVCLPIALTALLTIRPSREDFAPYMPVSTAICIMVIVYVVPWARKSFRARNSPQDIRLGELIRAEQRTRTSGSDAASMGSSSTRSSGISLWIMSRFIGLEPDPIVFTHLDHAEEYNSTTIPPAWETLSTGDLEAGLHPGSSQTSTTS
ncbi:hypothetical protein DL98DRAFT_101424 [Cadophora sp. DSE1049]|nr:hypothetical protein DL98DRAFT_101424 [Cadophora sp. DSE1049]